MRVFQLQKTDKTKIGIAIAFYAFLVMGISNNVIGVLLPSLQRTYNLTPASLTTLFLSQVSGAILSALTSSLLSKRIGFARMLLLASIILTSALVIYAYTNQWFVMVASTALLGMASGLINSGINTYIANQQRSSNLIVFVHAFYGIGSLLGSATATTLLAIGLNWRFVYLQTASLVGLMVVAMIWVIVYNYKPMNLYVTPSGANAKANLCLALNTPAVLLCGLLSFIYVGTEVSIGNWAYSVQSISRNTPELLAGYSVSAYWLGITVGRLGIGSLMKRWGAVRAINFSFALLMSGLVTWWLLPNQLLSLPLIGFALAVIYPATIGLLPQRIPATLVASAISFMTGASYLGLATILTVVNSLAEHSGLESIPLLMVFMGALMVVLNHWLVKYAIPQNH